MKKAPSLPSAPAGTNWKPVKPEDKPTQDNRVDLAMAAWSIGEHGTKEQVARALKALWKIIKEARNE